MSLVGDAGSDNMICLDLKIVGMDIMSEKREWWDRFGCRIELWAGLIGDFLDDAGNKLPSPSFCFHKDQASFDMMVVATEHAMAVETFIVAILSLL